MCRFISLCFFSCVPAILCISCEVQANGPETRARNPIRLRFEWGGGKPRHWNGVLELSDGRFEEPSSLGIEADEPGTLWVNDGALWIQRRSARVYDGFDVTVLAPQRATLSVIIQAAEESSVHGKFQLDLSKIGAKPRTLSIGEGNSRLSVRRAPGDTLRVQIDRSHLIYEPGEPFDAVVSFHSPAAVRDNQQRSRIDWRLSPARSETVLMGGTRAAELAALHNKESVSIPLKFAVPREEGVYEVSVWANDSSGKRLSSTVQLVVYSGQSDPGIVENSHTDGQSNSGGSRLVDSFNPNDANFFRRVRRIRNIPFFDNSLTRVFDAIREFRGLDPETPGRSSVEWSAFHLHVKEPQHPHRLVFTVAANHKQTFGFSILEPNSAGQFMPIGQDGGISVDPESQRPVSRRANSNTEYVRHEMIFWPKVVDPILLLHDLGNGKPIDVVKVELFHLDSLNRQAANRRPKSQSNKRLVGAYMHKPLLPENFGAKEALDVATRRSVDDWLTFKTAGARSIEYLKYAGFNSLLIAVLADGSTIYPSRLLQPTPRYDTGILSSAGKDPMRKDVLELLLRQYDRAGLVLIPELRFSTPLPKLEKTLVAHGDRARGIELISRTGQSWRQARGSRRGLAPFYNPLDPRVQTAILEVVGELVERYRDHASFAGIAVELSSDGYMQLPGLDWGYDDATVTRFEKETGIQIPPGPSDSRHERRFKFLTMQVRREWVRWRCASLARFYKKLANTVTTAKPNFRLILSCNGVLRGSNPDDNLLEELTTDGRLSELLPPKGLDFSLLRETAGVTVLRPVVVGSPDRTSTKIANRTANQHPGLNSAFSGPTPGTLLYRTPREFRIAEFDSISPWQPSYTWLATHITSSGWQRHAPYSQSLATNDSQVIFSGGWMIPCVPSEDSRRIRDIIREIPAITFHKCEKQQQPAVVRMARHNQKTYLYAVNNFSKEIRVVLRLSCNAKTSCHLLGQQATFRLNSRGRQSLARLTLAPYDVWACELDAADVRVVDVQVNVPTTSLAETQHRIQIFDRELSRVQNPRGTKKSVLANPGFEDTIGQGRPSGWEVSGKKTVSWAIDNDNPRSGRNSLVLVSNRQATAAASSILPSENSRLLSVSVWLRSDRDNMRVRLILDVSSAGKDRKQYTDVRVGREWRRYVFRVKDVRGRLSENPKLRVEVPDSGRVWIDDVDVQARRLTADDLRQVTKVFAAVALAWDEGRYADCQRMLDSYWGQLLVDDPGAIDPGPTPTPSRTARLFDLFPR